MARIKKVEMVVPFDRDGNLMDWARPDVQDPSVISPYVAAEWRPNYEFRDLLTLKGIFKGGRSSMKAVWADGEGHEYGMFTSHLGELLERSGVVRGRAYGRWTFCKKGQNFGIRSVGSPAVHEDVATLAVVMLGGDQAAAAAFVDRATEAIHA